MDLQGSTTYTDLQDSPHHRTYTQTTSRQCSHTQSIQPYQWAIQLHLDYMEKEHFPRCDSIFSSSICSKISTLFRQCLTINGIVLWCPSMCVIVWSLEPRGRIFMLSVYWNPLTRNIWNVVINLFQAIDCVEIYQGILYFWIITMDFHMVQCVWN